MTGRSHILLGATAWFCAMRWQIVTDDILSFSAGILGSVFPDIDTERSMLGARFKWLSRPLSRLLGHRGLTHSALFWAAMAVLVTTSAGTMALHGPLGAFLLGVTTHIGADLPTGGCQILAPLSRSRLALWPYARTGGVGEYLLLLPMIGLLGWFGLNAVPYHRMNAKSGLPHLRSHRLLHVPFSGDMPLPS